MTWNHRVYNVKNRNSGEDYFVVKEVYYDEKNEIMGSSNLFYGSETLEGLKWIAEKVINCTEKPIILEENQEKENHVIIEKLISYFEENKAKIADMSDVGNEIGIAIGKFISEKQGYELQDFLSGIKHGVSLAKGTHS